MELEKKTTYYKNGKKEEEYWINKNGKLEGEYKHWHENGNKWEESYCKKGYEEGIIKQWNEKGRNYLWEYRKNEAIWLKIKENYKQYKTLEKLITKRKRKKRRQTIKRLRTKIDGIQGDILIYNLIMEYCGNEIIEEAIEK